MPRKKAPQIYGAPIPESLLRIGSVVAMVGLSRPTVYRMIQRGEFPRPIRPLGRNSRVSAWKLSEVQSWIASKFTVTAKKGSAA